MRGTPENELKKKETTAKKPMVAWGWARDLCYADDCSFSWVIRVDIITMRFVVVRSWMVVDASGDSYGRLFMMMSKSLR